MKKPTHRKKLITTALPYANGSLHIGHMVEYVQADIWVRIQKMLGQHCLFLCADDAHGTPIMIRAEKEKITPEQLIARVQQEHEKDFADFMIDFDHYHSTHSPENQQLLNVIYERLKGNDDIEVRTIQQAYDPEKNMFLPDRFVKGDCPRCGSSDQYGDNCESCGATYLPTDLKNPRSTLSGATPIQKESEHYFFRLDRYQDKLQAWIKAGHLQPEVANKLHEWFQAGLQQWDISRDDPYFGFEIPNAPGKYFYVWLDAPIGYMATLKNLCEQNTQINFDDYWQPDSEAEVYHFIGKDIIYFHGLFWPAILSSSQFRTPTAIYSHGFLTVNGKKMSKSRGTFITARHYLQQFDAEYLRYYFAAKLGPGVDDIDLNLTDFMQRVNADLVGKVVNIASRCAGFITKKFDGQLAKQLDRPELYEQASQAGEQIAEYYLQRDYNRAIRDIMTLADQANQYIDAMKPWVLAKDESTLASVQSICTMGLNLFRLLMIYLQPVLPKMAATTWDFLALPTQRWEDSTVPLLDHAINPFKPLMQRITQEQLEALLVPTDETLNATTP